MRKVGGPCEKVCTELRFLNEYLPEDRDPVHAWSVILCVVFVAVAGNFGLLINKSVSAFLFGSREKN